VQEEERAGARRHVRSRFPHTERLHARGDFRPIQRLKDRIIGEHFDLLDQDRAAREVRQQQLIDEMRATIGTTKGDRPLLCGQEQGGESFGIPRGSRLNEHS
jgi:hypothetical protein